MRASLEDLLEAEESFRAECKRQRKPVLESPYSYSGFRDDEQGRQRFVRLRPRQALEYKKHRELCEQEGTVAADEPVLQHPIPEDQMPTLTNVGELPPELVHAAHVLVAMGCDSQTTPREAARMLAPDSFRTMGLVNSPWPWVHKTDYHMEEESVLSRAVAAMPGPIFNVRQTGRRLSRLRVQEGPLVQCMNCEQVHRGSRGPPSNGGPFSSSDEGVLRRHRSFQRGGSVSTQRHSLPEARKAEWARSRFMGQPRTYSPCGGGGVHVQR